MKLLVPLLSLGSPAAVAAVFASFGFGATPLSHAPLQPLAATGDKTQSLAHDAYALLDRKCGECHGAGAATAGFTFRRRETLLKFVKPGNAAASRIFLRITDHDDPMPPPSAKDPAPLTAAEQEIVRNWIAAGVPEPAAAANPVSAPPFITEDQVLRSIEADLRAAPEADRPYRRYFTLTNLKKRRRERCRASGIRHRSFEAAEQPVMGAEDRRSHAR